MDKIKCMTFTYILKLMLRLYIKVVHRYLGAINNKISRYQHNNTRNNIFKIMREHLINYC